MKQENEALAGLAAQEAAGRNAAKNIAALEILQRKQAEDAAIDARIAANQAGFQAAQLNTERELLRDNLAAERAAASSANFGLILISAIALVSLLAFGLWYATSGNRAANSASAGATTQTARNDATATGHDSTVTTPAPSKKTHSEYHPAASPVKVPAAQTKTEKIAPAVSPRPFKTPSSDSKASDSTASGDADADNADSNADSNSSDNNSDAVGTDPKMPGDLTEK